LPIHDVMRSLQESSIWTEISKDCIEQTASFFAMNRIQQN